jgi:hypothetical protein
MIPKAQGGTQQFGRVKVCSPNKTRGVSHCSLAVSILKYFKAKNYENSNISPCKNIIYKKIL